MKKGVVPALVAAALASSSTRPADAQTLTPLQSLLIVGTISGGLWAGILYFFHKIGADTCMFQPSSNGYYDLGGAYYDASTLTTRTEDCGRAEIDVAGTLRGPFGNELLVVQPNPTTGWNFEARFPHTGCTSSFGHQLSVSVNAFYACLNSGNFTVSRPIYVVSANGTSPPAGASVYNWPAGNLGGGKYGWTR